MKAIVANVLFGGIFGCLSCANSTQATPVKQKSTPEKQTEEQIVSLQLSAKSSVPAIPQVFNLIDNVLKINDQVEEFPGFKSAVKSSLDKEYRQWLEHATSSRVNLPLQTNYFFPRIAPETDCVLNFCDHPPEQKIQQLLSAPQQAYVHRTNEAALAVGFQKTFWPSKNQHQYWGITTVEHWGEPWGNGNDQQIRPAQLNYINASPTLAVGSSSLTFSGGGNYNLANPAVLDQGFNAVQKFEDFRGGVTYHHGIAQQLTMGVGFVYEDTWVGFTQLTYDSDILPIKTTVSLLAKESGTDFQTHIRFQPAPNLIANYYGDAQKQRFDANWGVYPGLTLIARGNSKAKSYSAGINIAVHNDFLSLSATAALDHEQNLQWQLNSQIGPLKFFHNSNQYQSNSELRSQLLNSDDLGVQCSAFVRHQTFAGKKEQQEFMVWGATIHSQTQVGQNQHQWSFDLGYGNSSRDHGWIANASVALQPDLFLKLGYQEISPLSDETKIKLQLSSN